MLPGSRSHWRTLLARLAVSSSPRTTKLYDRTGDEIRSTRSSGSRSETRLQSQFRAFRGLSAREGIEFLRGLVGLDIIAVDVNTVSPPLLLGAPTASPNSFTV